MAQNADYEPEHHLSSELEFDLFEDDSGMTFPGAVDAETWSPGSAASPQTPNSGVSQLGQADSQPTQSAPPKPAVKVTGGLALPAQALPKPARPAPAVANDSISPPESRRSGMLDERPANGLVNMADLDLKMAGKMPARDTPVHAAPAAPAAEIAQHASSPPGIGAFQHSFAELESIVDMPLGFDESLSDTLPAPAPTSSSSAPESVPAVSHAQAPTQQPPRRRRRVPRPATPPPPPPNYALQLGNNVPVPDALDADISAGRWGRWDPKKLCQGSYILTERSPYDPDSPRDVFDYMAAMHYAVHTGWPGKTHSPTMAAALWFAQAQGSLRDGIRMKSEEQMQWLMQGMLPSWMVEWGINAALQALSDVNLLSRQDAMDIVGKSFEMLDIFMQAETGMRGNETEGAPFMFSE